MWCVLKLVKSGEIMYSSGEKERNKLERQDLSVRKKELAGLDF